MNYKNNREVQRNDQVLGMDRNGRPVGGQVIDTDATGAQILVSPAFHSAVWVSAVKCLHVDDAFTEAPAPAPQPAPESPSEKSDQSEKSETP